MAKTTKNRAITAKCKIVDNLLRIQNAEAIETMLQLARGPFRLLQSVLSFDNTVSLNHLMALFWYSGRPVFMPLGNTSRYDVIIRCLSHVLLYP
jgi:hypothetical protein